MPNGDLTVGDLETLEGKVRRLFWLVFAGIGLAAVVIGLYVFQFHGPLGREAEGWAQFGDYVGGVLNPVFSFLALIALLWTISLQTKELRLSSTELRNSATALMAQNETLRLQTREATFFQLLQLHNEIVNAMDIVGVNKITKGRDCFTVYVRRLNDQLKDSDGFVELSRMRNGYDRFYEQSQRDLGHYFRLLYHIVKYVHGSDLGDRRFYTNLVRAQLSHDELVLIFFNGLSRFGDAKFKPLIEEYGLLKNLPESEFPSGALRRAYSATAFAGSANRDGATQSAVTL